MIHSYTQNGIGQHQTFLDISSGSNKKKRIVIAIHFVLILPSLPLVIIVIKTKQNTTHPIVQTTPKERPLRRMNQKDSYQNSRWLFLFLSLTLLFSCALSLPVNPVVRERNRLEAEDGLKCAACVFVVQDVVLNSDKLQKPVRSLLNKACGLLPSGKLNDICHFVVDNFTEDIIGLILSNETADFICAKAGLCKQCHLFQGQNYYNEKSVRMSSPLEIEELQVRSRILGSLMFYQWKANPDETGNVGQRPFIDLDKDWFSSVHSIPRGANWRGRDCNDWNHKVRPGVLEAKSGRSDNDCNGIPADFEQQYCSGANAPRQLIQLGDSATAGFMIPVEWLKLKNLSHVLPTIIDEFDHPEQAWGSGWDASKGTDSLYLRLRNNNRCIHRQFQSVAKNGAEMSDLSDQIDTLSYDKNTDKSALVTVAYIGNDICKKKLDLMTTPEEYQKNLKEGLTKLDNILAPNSKVLLFGLVDGSILFELMGQLEHPLGHGITYAKFYEFLTCTGVNPCNTWLTSNSTTRAIASARAMELTRIANDFVKNHKFNNFDLIFVDFAEILNEAFALTQKQGKPLSTLIDPVDGFHPYIRFGDAVLAQVLWAHLSKAHPDFIGPVNPFNEHIEKLFGDQGGY
jgi:acyloxyacyl hydrolase